MNKDVSVVVATYDNNRLPKLEQILEAWLAQAGEVFLCDCSGGKFKTTLPIVHIEFNKDLGSKTRHATLPLTTGEFIVLADDDLIPLPGLVGDYVDWWEKLGGIVGLIGRKFHGQSYYQNTDFHRANALLEPVEVDFCSHAMTPRTFIGFDLVGCHNSVEDLYWNMKVFPEVDKWVIPTNKYENLPEASDGHCLFHNEEARLEREQFYKKYYMLYYANRGKEGR